MNQQNKSRGVGITRGGFAVALLLCLFLIPSTASASLTDGLVGSAVRTVVVQEPAVIITTSATTTTP